VRGPVDQGSYGNELAAKLDDYLVDIPHPGNDFLDHQRLGQLRMRRREFESKFFHGEGCCGSRKEPCGFHGRQGSRSAA
jgi:type VI secretion system secreted protein VgrG